MKTYTLTRFKPSGKWYDDTEITFPEDIRPYANYDDVLRAFYGPDVYKWNGVNALRLDGNSMGVSHHGSRYSTVSLRGLP